MLFNARSIALSLEQVLAHHFKHLDEAIALVVCPKQEKIDKPCVTLCGNESSFVSESAKWWMLADRFVRRNHLRGSEQTVLKITGENQKRPMEVVRKEGGGGGRRNRLVMISP